jgi:hypothetical protein
MAGDIISWDKAIDKKVKSSDDKDLGKVQSITKEYIQTKEGALSKNYYFIPKYHIQGYDGDNLWVSLTKDEIKVNFEKEKAPDPSEFESPEYSQRRTNVIKQYPDFESNIPRYNSAAAAASGTSAAAGGGSGASQDMVGLPWENVIDKEVKSSDNKDAGKVESISANYLDVKEGHISKKHYYIQKYYVQGFDGHKLHTSITKDEIKDRYERDSPPSDSEYEEQRRKMESAYPQFSRGVPFMAKEPGVTLKSEPSGETLNIPWEEIIHKSVRTTDNRDIGDIETVGNEFVVVKEGDVKIRHYYIPKSYITHYDGSSIWIDAPSGLVSGKFERETEPTPEEIRMMSEEARKSKRE